MNITNFHREVISAGSMKNYIHILQRKSNEATIDIADPLPQFNEIWAGFTKLVDTRMVKRFDGVGLPQNTTHLCYGPFYQAIYQLDINTLWISKMGIYSPNKERYFKLKGIANFGEQEQHLIMYLEEKGFIENVANEG